MAFAGRYGGRGGDADALKAALRPDGPAEYLDLGELAVAATGLRADAHRNGNLCLIDGRVRTSALAEQLGLDPATPPERVVAAGYARLGDRVLEHIGGEFALVIWDAGSGRGLVARDRMAARPVFVAEHRGSVLFASEVRNLLRLLPSRPPPDAEALPRWLARAPMPGDATLFSGIRRLRGGEALRLGAGRRERLTFWRPRYEPPMTLDGRDGPIRIRDALQDAVNRALEGAERPAILLSGGVDSAVVAAVAVAGGFSPVAYSGVFPEHPEVDESDGIRRVREWLGLPGVEAEHRGGSAISGAVDFMLAWELPSVSPNRFLWAPLLSRAAQDGVDVLLDGEGGDEVFGCARYLVADHLLAARPLAALRTARRLPGMGEEPRARWLARALAVYGMRAAMPSGLHERLRAIRGRSRGPNWLAEPVNDGRWAWKDAAGPRWWAYQAHLLTADDLGAADQQRREAALHGLENRHPLLDSELIDLALRLPPDLGFDSRFDRPLMRRAIAGELPEEVLGSTRKPHFDPVLEAALTGPDASVLRTLLRDPHPELAWRLRRDASLEAIAGSGPGWSLDLWRLATLELWLRHGGGEPRERLLEGLQSAPASARLKEVGGCEHGYRGSTFPAEREVPRFRQGSQYGVREPGSSGLRDTRRPHGG